MCVHCVGLIFFASERASEEARGKLVDSGAIPSSPTDLRRTAPVFRCRAAMAEADRPYWTMTNAFFTTSGAPAEDSRAAAALLERKQRMAAALSDDLEQLVARAAVQGGALGDVYAFCAEHFGKPFSPDDVPMDGDGFPTAPLAEELPSGVTVPTPGANPVPDELGALLTAALTSVAIEEPENPAAAMKAFFERARDADADARAVMMNPRLRTHG